MVRKFKSITFRTMQGLGDIIWCLQRLHPFFETVNIRILKINDQFLRNELQKRSESLFVPMLPDFVNSTEMEECSGKEYHNVCISDFYVRHILNEYEKDSAKAEGTVFTFSTNHQLEEGKRLEQLDPGLSITEVLPFKFEGAEVPFNEWITLYVSGTNLGVKCWSLPEWAGYIDAVQNKFDTNFPVMLIGAEFDRSALEALGILLEKRGYKIGYFIGQKSTKVLYFLRRTKLFIGFQSGLNVLCDQLDTPQVMLYFDFLTGLRKSWPKQGNIDSGLHQAFGFEDTPAQVVEKMKMWSSKDGSSCNEA